MRDMKIRITRGDVIEGEGIIGMVIVSDRMMEGSGHI